MAQRSQRRAHDRLAGTGKHVTTDLCIGVRICPQPYTLSSAVQGHTVVDVNALQPDTRTHTHTCCEDHDDNDDYAVLMGLN